VSCPDDAPDGPQRSSFGTLTNAKLTEHNRQLASFDVAQDAGTNRATRLTVAARSLGIDISDIVKERAEDMEGTLPMERFLAETSQSTLAKLMNEKIDEYKGTT
jgi:hypothetical protein